MLSLTFTELTSISQLKCLSCTHRGYVCYAFGYLFVAVRAKWLESKSRAAGGKQVESITVVGSPLLWATFPSRNWGEMEMLWRGKG